MEADYINGIIGGSLIGLSAILLLLFNGRIAGISGIAATLLTSRPDKHEVWRLLFILGLIGGAMLYMFFFGPLNLEMQASRPMLVVAGLLVGIGTQVGSGCTSGHGVCGIARGSLRSILATIVFMGVAIVTVYTKRRLGL